MRIFRRRSADTGLFRLECGGGSVGDLEFGEDLGDMVADRLFGHAETSGDFVIAAGGRE